ncbi:unnamed protein product [Chrysoparadoxa australica]
MRFLVAPNQLLLFSSLWAGSEGFSLLPCKPAVARYSSKGISVLYAKPFPQQTPRTAGPGLRLTELPGEDAPLPAKTWKNSAKVAAYFGLWYLLNVGYNIYNKKTLNMISIPWIISAGQLAVGSLYVNLVWLTGIRKGPKLTKDTIKSIFPLAALHTTSHISAVIALGAGAIGFVHILKSLEPLFTAFFSAVFFKQIMSFPVYASMIPVVGGVALASLKELSFSWTAFAGAMGSNAAASARGVWGKSTMGKMKKMEGANLDAGNIYGVMTIIATLLLAPLAALVEGPKLAPLLDAAIGNGYTTRAIATGTLLSGLYFYLYNEVAFYCLNAIDPLTHSLGNTLKRVVLLALSILMFGHKLTTLGLIGSGTAILGVFLYGLAKNSYTKSLEDKKATPAPVAVPAVVAEATAGDSASE